MNGAPTTTVADRNRDAARRRLGLSALNILKLRANGVFVLPEPVVRSVAACLPALADGDRAHLLAVIHAFDAAAGERLAREA